jgi:hypothetical protein
MRCGTGRKRRAAVPRLRGGLLGPRRFLAYAAGYLAYGGSSLTRRVTWPTAVPRLRVGLLGLRPFLAYASGYLACGRSSLTRQALRIKMPPRFTLTTEALCTDVK